jgi:prephenate dehydrogenase
LSAAPTPDAVLRRVLVVGTGLIGTSVALGLTAGGVEVFLDDADPARVSLATELGAGRPLQPGRDADHAVIAVPPAQVAPALRRIQDRGLAPSASDVASVKSGPLAAAAALGCDLAAFVGGHPVAGRERSGPAAARPDLFSGRPWVLTPTERTAGPTVALARAVAVGCGAIPVLMSPEEHDEALALVSHGPQLVASALAGLLLDAAGHTVELAGQGLRDLTRIAASDAELWADIALSNAGPVADVLRRVSGGLAGAADALLAGDAAAVQRLLRAGNVGYATLPGKHSRPAASYAGVPVVVPDEPGRLARLLADAAHAGVNVEDLAVEHAPGAPVGVIELAVVPSQAEALALALRRQGWSVHPINPP